MLMSDYRDVPAMDGSGWYPNPAKKGGLVNGDAVFQRFWDSIAWTDQIRIRDGKRWTTGSISLHAEPVDESRLKLGDNNQGRTGQVSQSVGVAKQRTLPVQIRDAYRRVALFSNLARIG